MRYRLLQWGTRQAWFCLGLLAILTAAIGVVLPLVPTTPLVILAAFAFSKSSPRFEKWLVEHKLFGPIIADWRANGAIAPAYKAIAVTMMAAVFGLSLWVGVPTAVLVIQGAVLTLAAAFVLTRPSHAMATAEGVTEKKKGQEEARP